MLSTLSTCIIKLEKDRWLLLEDNKPRAFVYRLQRTHNETKTNTNVKNTIQNTKTLSKIIMKS